MNILEYEEAVPHTYMTDFARALPNVYFFFDSAHPVAKKF
jgi:hypothetical protein